MLTEILDSAYFALILIIVFVELVRQKNELPDFLTFFHIGFILWYIIPAFLTAFDPENAVSDIWLDIKGEANNLETALAIFVGYFFIVTGFYAKSARRLAKKVVIKSRRSLPILIYTVLLLLLVAISIHIYSIPLGGVATAITKGLEVRGGQVETGQLGFFIRFIGGAAFASYLLMSFVLNQDLKKTRWIYIVLFVISVLMAIISFLMRAGRLDVIFYFLGFYQIIIQKYRKVPWIFGFGFVCFTAFFLFYGKNVFAGMAAIPDGFDAVIEKFTQSVEGSGQDEGFNIYGLMGNFYYPFFSLNVALSYDYELRWFVDLLYGALSLLPDRLMNSEPPQTILYYNTMLITGGFDFGIPTGLLAFGIYSLWWPGLIISCWVYGWSGGYLQTILEQNIKHIFWMPSFYALLSQIWFGLQSSDPETFLQSNFIFLASIIFLLAVGTKISITSDRSEKVSGNSS
jgi:hypothetical protein